MTISERTLRKWRKEALEVVLEESEINVTDGIVHLNRGILLSDRILKMTQELLDQHLIKGGK